jgi:signal transduction histidine kinase
LSATARASIMASVPRRAALQVVTVVGAAVAVAAVATSIAVTIADGASPAEAALSGAVVAAFVVVGCVVTAARPANAVGWALLGGGVAWALGAAAVDVARHGIVVAPGSVAGASAWAVVGSALRSVGWLVTTVGVAAVFPDGHVPGPRWRWLPRVLAVGCAASVIGVVTADDANVLGLGAWTNPLALPGAGQAVSGVLSLVGLVAGVAAAAGAVASLVARWRRGDALVRDQVGLVAATAALPVVTAPLVLTGVAGPWLFSVTSLPLPLAIGAAVLARGLYDVRTAVSRTLVWVTLSVALAATYVLVVAGVGALVHDTGAPWLPWAAACVVAIAFAPLRTALQRGVDRLVLGRWSEPYAVVAGLTQRLEAVADVPLLLDELATDLGDLGLGDVQILDASGARLAGARVSTPEATAMPLVAYGRRVGTLRYVEPAGGLRRRDRALLDHLTGLLGSAVHVDRLTADLQASLERTVLGREEERRRLRRDLHDGIGPALAGHVLRLDLAAASLDDGTPAAELLRDLRTEVQATMSELRAVVDGLRPAALDELGLAEALRQGAGRLAGPAGLAVEVEIDDLPPLSAAVEVAAYRIAMEGVTNVVKHAGATRCEVRVRLEGHAIEVSVADDGVGLAQHSTGSGSGTTTMAERAQELGGTLRIGPALDGPGTLVVATVPIDAGRGVAAAADIAQAGSS